MNIINQLTFLKGNERKNKIFIIMKLSGILLFIATLQIMAVGYSQTVSLNLNMNKTPLREVFKEIERQSELSFIFSDDISSLNEEVSVNVHNENIKDILNQLFKDTNLGYQILNEKLIVIAPKTVFSQGITVTGAITDEKNEPMVGVNVVEKGTTNGAVTDIDGKYTLSVSSKDAVIMFSFVGYVAREIIVADQREISVALEEDLQKLDEVIVIGYGTNTKRSVISAVSTVDASELKNIPVANITQGLAGRAPGLIVKASGGGINKNSNVTIRGGGTPLVVIDGIIRSYSDFTSISSSDIESMMILKDASATAAYGSRAANGILQITTKRGFAKKIPTVELSFNQSFSQPNIWPKKLGSYDRASYINQALANDKLSPYYTDEQLQKFKDQTDPWNYPDVDWQKETLKNFASMQKYDLALSGGSENNNYYISLGHINQGSLYRSNSHYLKRTNFRVNQVSTIKNIGVKLTMQVDGYFQKVRRPLTSTNTYNKDDPYFYVFSHIQNKKPWELAYNKSGLIYQVPDNPIAETSMNGGYANDLEKVGNGLLSAEWSLPWVTGLKLRATGNYRYAATESNRWQKDTPQYPLESAEPKIAAQPSLYRDTGSNGAYTLQFFADYQKTIGDHTFNVLAGYEAQSGRGTSQWMSRDSYIFNIDQMNAGPAATSKNGGNESENGRAGYVAQVKYNYQNKYFAEGSLRYDGSDNFAPDNRWGLFYSGSLGWSLADEKFWEPLREKNILNTFKLRGSYGQVGLDNWDDPYKIGRFSYLSSYGYVDRSYVIGDAMYPGFNEGALPSPDLTWFTTTQIDLGVDMSSLNSRLYGSIDYFYYKTTGFLYAPSALDVGYTEPLGTGLPKVSTDGEHRRAGWEFQVGYRDQLGDFEYNIGANFTYFNQLWAINPAESLESMKNPYQRTTQQVGYNSVGLISHGFYNGNADVYNSVKPLSSTQLVSGDVKYEDFNGDGVIDDQDRVRIGKNGFPRGNYGINMDMRYKGFFLGMLFQGATRFDMYAGSTVMMNDAQSGSTPVYDFQTDFWTTGNTDAKFPRLLSSPGVNGAHNYRNSDFWLINCGYFRMKDARFGYDFKQQLLKNVKWVSRLELVLSGQNIFTISKATKYGMDPENASNNNYSYPMERTFSLGVNLGF